MPITPVRRKDSKALKKIYKGLKELTKKEIALGFPEGKCHPYDEPPYLGVAEVAAKQVFGVGVPQRDFMSQARPIIEEKCRKVLKAIVKVAEIGSDPSELLEAAGLYGSEAIKEAIEEGDYEPLSPYTIQKRIENGRPSTKPLIDTAHMITSATYVVREKR